MQRQVAPLVGAWIEMHLLILQRLLVSVAPLVGAWIEIVIVWKCGVKIWRSLLL